MVRSSLFSSSFQGVDDAEAAAGDSKERGESSGVYMACNLRVNMACNLLAS